MTVKKSAASQALYACCDISVSVKGKGGRTVATAVRAGELLPALGDAQRDWLLRRHHAEAR
tara:strand:- start:16125 stop:16307 length:183 start_codon:yes stop_codon:yes gene_type:complete